MPEISYAAVMNAPRPRVWEFVRDMNNWAPLTRGYQSHEVLNDQESVWTVKGDLGPISRITKVHVTITEWVEGERVGFTVRGLNEPISGEGAIRLGDNGNAGQTQIRGEATIAFGGSLGPVVNELIAPFIRSGADELVTKITLAVTGQAPLPAKRRVFLLDMSVAVWRALKAAVLGLLRALARPFRRGDRQRP